MTHPIPPDALAHHIAILGKTGSGKSNAAKTVVESELDAGGRVCILDPTGAWYGLRLEVDGSPSNYPVVIFGGRHADIAITGAHGAGIAEIIGTSSTPAVIDTRLMTVGERTRFFTDFAEALLRANSGPLTLVIDEAHLFAPQGRVSDPQSGKMLHAANNLVSLGRSIGLRIIMLSQRPAKLHKDSLTQVETLVAMRMLAPQDRAAVEAWIGEWATPAKGRDIIASLPSLPTGDAWIWSPEIGFLERRHFPLARTFDSGKAPSDAAGGPALAPIDIGAVADRLARISGEPSGGRQKPSDADVERLISVAYQDGFNDGYLAGQEDAFTRARLALDGLGVQATVRAPTITPPAASASEPVAATAPPAGNPKGALGLVAAAARMHPTRLTWGQIATLAGRKPRGGHFNASRKTAIDSSWLTEVDGLVSVHALGLEAAGVRPATGATADMWAQVLPQPAAKIFQALRVSPMSLQGLAATLEMQPRGGHWNNGIATLRRNHLIVDRDGVLHLTDVANGRP